MKRVVIDRKKWGRRALLNSKGKMCCLGFCAKSAGVKPESMRGTSMPNNLGYERARVAEKFPMLLEVDYNSFDNADIAYQLATVNDGMVNGAKKEAKIKQLGKQAGIDFVFTGSYA